MQVEMLPRIMPREDDDAAALVTASLRDNGVDVLTEHKAVRFAREGLGSLDDVLVSRSARAVLKQRSIRPKRAMMARSPYGPYRQLR